MILKELCFLFMGIVSFTFSFSQTSEWELRKDEQGVKVYTRHADGFSIDEMMTQTTVKAPLVAVIAVIMDADHYTDWVYACAESRIVKKISETEQYQYLVNNMPYPFSDRDVVIHYKIWQDQETKKVYTSSTSDPDFLDNAEDKVRIPIFIASYELMPKENGEIGITYQLKLDPGGSIPDWMVNWFIIKGPYESLVNMRERIESGRYDSVTFSFLKE